MRREFKYLVPYEAVDALRAVTLRYAERDPNGLDGPYTVRSIYFDTTGGSSYEQKIEGVAERVKVRVRGYGNDDPGARVVLELKRKRGDGSWKSRARTDLAHARRFVRGGDGLDRFDESERANASRFRYFVRRYSMHPVGLVTYDREAFVGVHDPSLRITFDDRLRGRLTDSLKDLAMPCVLEVFDRHLILEVKFDYHFPSWLKPCLGDFGLTRRALSKYTLTVEACARRTHRAPDAIFRGRWVRRGSMMSPADESI